MPGGDVQTTATAPRTVRVTTETALLELLDDAAREPIILERDGERFRLSRDEDIVYQPDPEGVRAMLARPLARHTPWSPAKTRSSRV